MKTPTDSETAPAPRGTEAAPTTQNVPRFCEDIKCPMRGQACGRDPEVCDEQRPELLLPAVCRTCPLRHQPCGYYPEECETMTEAELARRPKDQMDMVAWMLDRVFDYPKREEAPHGRC